MIVQRKSNTCDGESWNFKWVKICMVFAVEQSIPPCLCKCTLGNTQLVVRFEPCVLSCRCFDWIRMFECFNYRCNLQRPFPRTVQGLSQSSGKPWECPTHIQWGKVQAILHQKGLLSVGYHLARISQCVRCEWIGLSPKWLFFCFVFSSNFSCAFLMDCSRTGVSIRKQSKSHLSRRKEELACVFSPSQLRKSWWGIWTWVFGFVVWCSFCWTVACEMSHLNVASAFKRSVCQLKREEQLNSTCQCLSNWQIVRFKARGSFISYARRIWACVCCSLYSLFGTDHLIICYSD